MRAPLHRNPVPFKRADLVFMESTYGDRDHPSLAETASRRAEAIRRPSNEADECRAVSRSAVPNPALLARRRLQAQDDEAVPDFLDSPMAIRATEMYTAHTELFDTEACHAAAGELSAQLRTAQVCQ